MLGEVTCMETADPKSYQSESFVSVKLLNEVDMSDMIFQDILP